MSIKILHWEAPQPKEDAQFPKYSIKTENNKLFVEYSVPYNKVFRKGNFEIDLSIKEKVYDIFLFESYGFKTDIVEAFTYCNRQGYTTNYLDKKKVARVIIDDKGNVIVVLVFATNDIKGFENITMKASEYPASHYVREICPWFINLQNKTGIKADLVRKLDVYKSIAYLEAQVDLLTKIVLEKGTPEMINALEKADEESVLNIKNMDAVIKEFTENKHYVREGQKVYYNAITKK